MPDSFDPVKPLDCDLGFCDLTAARVAYLQGGPVMFCAKHYDELKDAFKELPESVFCERHLNEDL